MLTAALLPGGRFSARTRFALVRSEARHPEAGLPVAESAAAPRAAARTRRGRAQSSSRCRRERRCRRARPCAVVAQRHWCACGRALKSGCATCLRAAQSSVRAFSRCCAFPCSRGPASISRWWRSAATRTSARSRSGSRPFSRCGSSWARCSPTANRFRCRYWYLLERHRRVVRVVGGVARLVAASCVYEGANWAPKSAGDWRRSPFSTWPPEPEWRSGRCWSSPSRAPVSCRCLR